MNLEEYRQKFLEGATTEEIKVFKLLLQVKPDLLTDQLERLNAIKAYYDAEKSGDADLIAKCEAGLKAAIEKLVADEAEHIAGSGE